MTAKSDELIAELVSACVAFGREKEPDWQTRIETARVALKAHIEELEVETETVAGDYEDRMDNLINKGNETGRLLQSEIGYLNAQLNIKNETTKFLQLRIAELEGLVDELIEAGESMSLAVECENQIEANAYYSWKELVKDWKERER